jgi:hypothetical protein
VNPLTGTAEPTDTSPAAGQSTAEGSTRASLSTSERDELFALLVANFEGVTALQFARDLDDKDWVLRIRQNGRLIGFTTLKVYSTHFEGETVNVIYSGDTITEPDAWGSPALARGWIGLVRRLKADRASERWYWLLLSSGFRTYRFLPVFFREFWPRHDVPQPPSHFARLLSHLARERFGERFHEPAGIVRFDHPQRLRENLASIPDGRRDDRHVAFFLERNPGHGDGDELVCLCDLSDTNLTAAGERMVRSRA